jgi:signal transduction histidine kinase
MGTAVRIGTRITFTTTALVAATLGVYAFITLRSQRADRLAQIESRARELASSLRVSVENRSSESFPMVAAELGPSLRQAAPPWRIELRDTSGLPSSDSGPSADTATERLRRMVTLRSAITEVTEIGGTPTFVYLEPIRLGPRIVGALELSRDIDSMEGGGLEDATIRTLVSMGIVVALVVLAISISTRSSVSRPIAKLIAGIDDVAKGDLSHVLLAEREDEVGALAARFNEMTQSLRDARAETRRGVEVRLALEAHLRDSAQLATIGQLAAEIAHEVGTPLNVVTGRARALVKKADDPDAARKNATIIAEQAARITRIIQRLLDIARRKVAGGDRGPVDLNKLAGDTLELLEYQLGSARVETATRLDRELGAIPGNRDQLQQVFLNLYMNAIEAMPGGGRLAVRTARSSRRRPGLEVDPERRYAVLEVSDTGVGIDEKDRDKIFEAFYTSKAGSGGTGLGLSVAHGIVKDHDGWIEIDDHIEAGRGTVFRVYLPEEADARREQHE